MKNALLYDIEQDRMVPVTVITKHSSGICVIQIATLQKQVSATELEYPKPNPPRFNTVDPLEAMKLSTEYWGSCMKPSPYNKDNGCARWLGKGARPTLDLRPAFQGVK